MVTPNQNISLKQQQTHTITPQLQQAIKLLQLNNIELSEFVNEQLEENPFLETADGDMADERPLSEDTPVQADEISDSADNTQLDDNFVENNSIDGVGTERVENPEFDTIGKLETNTGDVDEANIDQHSNVDANEMFTLDAQSNTEQWSSSTGSGTSNTSGGASDGGDLDMISSMTAAEPSLYDVLTEQISLAFSHDDDQMHIAYSLLDELEDDGYLRLNIHDFAEDNMFATPLVEKTLARMQTFEPTGIFARNLGECFALQLDEMGDLTPEWSAFLDNLGLIQQGKHKQIMKLAGIDEDQFKTMVKRLKSLDPKPAHQYSNNDTPAVIPDVFLRKMSNGDYRIELNASTLPRVIVNEKFYGTVRATQKTDDEKVYYSEQMNTANWLVKAIHQRAVTITKVATAIATRQKDFFDKGVMHLKPMTLKDIADDIEMHESTVSRVTTNKYIYSDKGMFELKYFFSAALSSGDGDVSAEAIRHQIKDILKNETIDHIYSDEELASILQKGGIDVARRTVAKYREEVGIPSSSKRRKQLKLNAVIA